MNKKLRVLLGGMALMAMAPLSALAADLFINITDANGVTKTISCPSGTCAVSGLAVGQYQVQVCDEKGAPVKSSTVELQHAIVSPRDSASGLATGKRQYKPLLVRHPTENTENKTWDLLIADQGSQVVIETVSGKVPARLDAIEQKIARPVK